jgi:predicted  nucleic acid-binding Zn-ribbon protein
MANQALALQGFKDPLLKVLKDLEVKVNQQITNFEQLKIVRSAVDPEREALKKKILIKSKNVSNLKEKIERLKAENEARKKHITNFKEFVKERQESIKNVEIIEISVNNNTTKKTSLVERR